MKLAILAGAAAAVVFTGCSDPSKDVPAASVSGSTNASANAAPSAPASLSAPQKAYSFSTNGSSVSFVGSKVTGSHEGGFKNFAGEIAVRDGKVADTGTRLVIDTTSLWSDSDRLTGHLKNSDFFDVAKYPTSTFTTTSVTHQGTNATVTGKLTLHGITRQISFPAAVRVTDNSVEINANFSINRFDFDMKYAGKADDLIREGVVLKIQIKAAPGNSNSPLLRANAKAG